MAATIAWRPSIQEANGIMDFMQIDTIRTISRGHNRKHQELRFKPRRPLAPPRSATSPAMSTPASSQADFSPLVQEFLDDCDYSSR
jgi:hypothetical protein